MKHTIKQVLAFCDAIYKSETEKAGGRDGYLITPVKQHINELKRPVIDRYGFPSAIVFCLILAGINIYMLTVDGLNASSFAGLAIDATLIIFSLSRIKKSKIFWNGMKETYRTYAHWHEPEEIWSLDYPRDNKARASLIRSLLGARIFNNRLMQMTAIPMDQKVIDTRVAHLVKEIAASKDEDIHPYLVEEVKSFCRQAVSDMDFYSPIITLQEELEKAEAE